jgi:tRNA U34 2-thiouridine synthase MnmA/TrmU
VEFDEPQFAVAPGQALVVYDTGDSDTVMGGGWIESA